MVSKPWQWSGPCRAFQESRGGTLLGLPRGEFLSLNVLRKGANTALPQGKTWQGERSLWQNALRLRICHKETCSGGAGNHINSHNWHLSHNMVKKSCCLWVGRMGSDPPGKPALSVTCVFLCLRAMLELTHLFTGNRTKHPSQLLPKAASPGRDQSAFKSAPF